MQRTEKATGEKAELFCVGADFEAIIDVKQMLELQWLMPTDQQREKIMPWASVPKLPQTWPEPVYMRDIRDCRAKLIKYYLYCYDYTLGQINHFIAQSHDLKAQRYDKNLIHAGTSDSTAIRAEKTLTNPKHLEDKRIVQAITDTFSHYEITNDKMAEFMKLAYQVDEHGKKKYTEAQLIEMLKISAGTVFLWKKYIIKRVAMCLGWELPPEYDREEK